VPSEPFFDAHCDTVLKVLDEGADFPRGAPTTHIDLPRLRDAGVRAQVFACFVLSERYPGEEAHRLSELLESIDGLVASTEGELHIARTASELRDAFEGGPMAAIVGMEGADALEGRAENLRAWVERGVRNMIFAWQDNPFSGTAFGKNTPLTAEGARLLELCEDLGVMVDVSHLSDAAFDDVCRMSTRSFIASYSNCRAVCPSARNLTDEMIRKLADRGGVMGLNLSTGFLSPRALDAWKDVKRALAAESVDWREAERRAQEIAPSIPRPPFDWIVKHVLHAIDVGGEDVVGLGGDLDGILHLPDGIDGVEDYPEIPEALRRAGLDDRRIAKFCRGNFLRAFEECLPG